MSALAFSTKSLQSSIQIIFVTEAKIHMVTYIDIIMYRHIDTHAEQEWARE